MVLAQEQRSSGGRLTAVEALARVSRAVADGGSIAATLSAIGDAVADAVAADIVVVRELDADGALRVRAVAAASRALAAELEGSREPATELVSTEPGDPPLLPPWVARLAERMGAGGALVEPVRAAGVLLGTLEVVRVGRAFDDDERLLARAAADQAAAALRAAGASAARNGTSDGSRLLERAGEALAAGPDEERAAFEVARVAVDATGAVACTLWRRGDGRMARPMARFGEDASIPLERAAALAEETLDGGRALVVTEEGSRTVVTIQAGRPILCALQLVFGADTRPSDAVLEELARFGVRAVQALRARERAREVVLELERTQALLALVGQANAQLSLSHTLDAMTTRLVELVGTDRIGVYLREDGRLTAAAVRGLSGAHVAVAERLLELALGKFRGRGMLELPDVRADVSLAGLRGELAAEGIEAAVAAPLLVPDGVSGLLVFYPQRGRRLTPHEAALVRAFAAQLAVAVQNARLHEQATDLGADLEKVLELERQSARQLRALYEISRSFAQSLSLETTLDAVVRTVVELLEVDGAVIRMPDARRETLVPRALHIADARVGEALRAILLRPQPIERVPIWKAFRSGRPIVLDAALARTLGPPHELLVPFLVKGSTAVILPIATPSELLGTLKLLSLDPDRPITAETTELGLSVAAQAALAIDNARLYQHQKEFSDTMQRSLLPRSLPALEGLDLGDVYESSGRVDVGGDVYDFLLLDDGRLAVVLGDVTGHGIEAAADMAMAKFVFRSLAREHPEPGEFLAAANDVVCDEIASGKFITMTYLTVDPASGELGCASAGHPQPRVVLPDGSVDTLSVRGLALGIDEGQSYDELRASLPRGASVVLYTDGVIEARRDGELYGTARLDALMSSRRGLRAGDLARAILADCRAFAAGELADDCAVVVIKRTDS